jgi:hypothetical protein
VQSGGGGGELKCGLYGVTRIPMEGKKVLYYDKSNTVQKYILKYSNSDFEHAGTNFNVVLLYLHYIVYYVGFIAINNSVGAWTKCTVT